jgi:hypothetical protein
MEPFLLVEGPGLKAKRVYYTLDSDVMFGDGSRRGKIYQILNETRDYEINPT